eukprot:g33233.t1
MFFQTISEPSWTEPVTGACSGHLALNRKDLDENIGGMVNFRETKNHLVSINSTQHLVLGVQQQLLRELQIVRSDIRATLSNPDCQGCETSIARLEDLQLNINYSEGRKLPSLPDLDLHVTPDPQQCVVDSELPSGQLGMGNKCCLAS